MRFVITIVILAIGVTSLALSAQGQKSRKPVSKTELIGFLEAGMPASEIEGLVRQYGVSFELTRQTEAELRRAGAAEGLLKVIRQVAPHSTSPSTPPPAAPEPTPPSPPVLLIEATPGGAQVYLDDEPIGTTSPEGRLKLSHLTPGQHRVRLSMAGRRDYQQDVELTGGETTRVTTSLEAVPAALPPTSPPAGVGTTSRASVPAVSQPPVASPKVATFYVAHDHGPPAPNFCVGVMTIGNGMVQYRSSNGIHSFALPFSEIKEAKKNGVYLANLGAFHIRPRTGPVYNFVVINTSGQYQRPDALLEALQRDLGQ